MIKKDIINRIRASIKWIGNSEPWSYEQGKVFDRIDDAFEKKDLYFIDLVKEEKK